jgi:hypothetical protein
MIKKLAPLMIKKKMKQNGTQKSDTCSMSGHAMFLPILFSFLKGVPKKMTSPCHFSPHSPGQGPGGDGTRSLAFVNDSGGM